MMDRRETVFDFIGRIFMLFGITVVMLMIIATALGSKLTTDSVMFSLGHKGLSISLLIQFFMISTLIITLNELFMTDRVIKEASSAIRMVGMLATILITMCGFIFVFNWFPTGDWTSWAMFFTFFFVNFLISILVVHVKEKLENRQMEEGLKRFKARYKEQINESKHRD